MILDISICAAYLLFVFALGIWFARGQHDNEDYFVGGRRMHWLPIGLSIFAGTFSALSFVGLPRESAYDDYQFFLAILFIPLVVTPIVCWLFLPLYFRLQLTSCYEYLELRFHRGVRLLASGLYAFYTIGWMGNMLVAVGKILQEVMRLSDTQLAWMLIAVGLFATLYTTIGGVKAVVWTDTLQAFALGIGMLVVLVTAVSKIDGGWWAIWSIGLEHDKFKLVHIDWSWSGIVKKTNVLSICATGFFVYLAGHAVHFTAVQRYVSMPSIVAARKSLVVNGVMVVAVCLVFFLVGSALFAYYQQTGDVAYGELQDAGKEDQLLPRFITTVIPQFGLAGLLLAGLFAAAMSSIDSGINSLTATVVCDWLAGRHPRLWVSRLLCAGFGLAAVIDSSRPATIRRQRLSRSDGHRRYVSWHFAGSVSVGYVDTPCKYLWSDRWIPFWRCLCGPVDVGRDWRTLVRRDCVCSNVRYWHHGKSFFPTAERKEDEGIGYWENPARTKVSYRSLDRKTSFNSADVAFPVLDGDGQHGPFDAVNRACQLQFPTVAR